MRALVQGLRRSRIALLGLGIENRALARFLAARNVRFRVCDAVAPADQDVLTEQLGGCVEGWTVGEEYLRDLERFDLVFRTPGISPERRELAAARTAGVRVSSQTRLFADASPAPLIGVTGTKGKGTTASLLAAMLREDGERRVWLGGNIGTPPVGWLGRIEKDDLAVLELSSFQLADWEVSPHGAMLLNVTQDHLDYHGTAAAYREAKRRICRFQGTNDWLVSDDDCPVTAELVRDCVGTRLRFSVDHEVDQGAWIRGDSIFVRLPGGCAAAVCALSDIRLRGRHNLSNVAAAAAAARMNGVSAEAIRRAVREFAGLPHRLDQVTVRRGVAFYSDSLATTPSAAAAALAAFEEPVVLIAGGASKGVDFKELAEAVVSQRVRSVVLIGLEAGRIAAALLSAGWSEKQVIQGGRSMDHAVRLAFGCARPGDVVLLAPACASFDMFADYQARAEAFAAAANAMPEGPV